MAKFLFFDDQLINVLLKSEKPSGGSAVQTYGWIRGLMAHGQDVVVMTDLKNAGDVKDSCRDIQLVPFYDRNKGARWLRWVYYRIPHIYRTIKRSGADYVYQGVPGWTTFILGVICRVLGMKLVVRISNDFIVDDRIFKKFSRAYWLLQEQGIRMSYCVLCQNKYQYRKINERFPGKKVVMISNPIFEKYEGEIIPASERKYIAWMGIFQYQKNIPLLFEIAKTLPNRHFVVAGKEDPKCDLETSQYLEKLRQLPNVEFAGFLGRQAVLDCIAHAEYLLNTSHYEGFSNTFLEAMCCGTPILTTNDVNPDSIISEKLLGIVYSNAKDLAKKLSFINQDSYAMLSANNCQYVKQHHDYKKLAGTLISILDEKHVEADIQRTLRKMRDPIKSLTKI